jgi:aminomethyltransferase
MGYVETRLSAVGTKLFGDLRGKRRPVTIAPTPFVPANFKR